MWDTKPVWKNSWFLFFGDKSGENLKALQNTNRMYTSFDLTMKACRVTVSSHRHFFVSIFTVCFVFFCSKWVALICQRLVSLTLGGSLYQTPATGLRSWQTGRLITIQILVNLFCVPHIVSAGSSIAIIREIREKWRRNHMCINVLQWNISLTIRFCWRTCPQSPSQQSWTRWRLRACWAAPTPASCGCCATTSSTTSRWAASCRCGTSWTNAPSCWRRAGLPPGEGGAVEEVALCRTEPVWEEVEGQLTPAAAAATVVQLVVTELLVMVVLGGVKPRSWGPTSPSVAPHLPAARQRVRASLPAAPTTSAPETGAVLGEVVQLQLGLHWTEEGLATPPATAPRQEEKRPFWLRKRRMR